MLTGRIDFLQYSTTLVALAALSAISAFAQTSVAIDGYFDRGYASTNNTDNNKDAKAVASNAGTTTIGVKVREDLGNGLSVGGSVNTDWNDLGGNKQNDTTGTAQRGGFANSQNFLDVTSNQYGVLRLGTPNSFTLTNATAVASPAYSTGFGSSYSSSFSIANGFGTGTTDKGGIVAASSELMTTAATPLGYVGGSSTAALTGPSTGQRSIRIANTVQYSSPVVLGGLTAHVGYTPKNDNDTGAGKLNTVGAQEYALRYTNGPIDAMYTSMKYTVGSSTNFFMGGTTSTAYKDMTSTQNLLGVTYAVMPALKLHAGLGQFKSSDDAKYKGASRQFGATYTTGAWVLSAQTARVDDQNSTLDYDRKLVGAGVDYNLSKTARVYFRYDNIDYATNRAAFDGSKQTRYALGVSESF